MACRSDRPVICLAWAGCEAHSCFVETAAASLRYLSLLSLSTCCSAFLWLQRESGRYFEEGKLARAIISCHVVCVRAAGLPSCHLPTSRCMLDRAAQGRFLRFLTPK